MQKKIKKRKENPENAEKSTKIAELTGQLQRVQAEFENYQKRMEKQHNQYKEQATETVLQEVLPIMDSFEQAIKQDTGEGIKRLYQQLKQVFDRYNVKAIESVGKPFNPHLHECVQHRHEKEKEDNIILEEIQKGYLIGNRVLRIAKVTVNCNE